MPPENYYNTGSPRDEQTFNELMLQYLLCSGAVHDPFPKPELVINRGVTSYKRNYKTAIPKDDGGYIYV